MIPLELFVVAAAAVDGLSLGGVGFEAGHEEGPSIRLMEVDDDRDLQTQLADRLRVYYGLYVGTFRKYLLYEDDASADDRLEAAWMLLLSVHRMTSMVGAGGIDAVVDGSLLDLLRIALDATSSGATYSLNQTARLTSDDVRKVERSVRSMAAARSLHIDGCISPLLPSCDPTCYWFVRWLMVLCLPSTSTAAAGDAAVDAAGDAAGDAAAVSAVSVPVDRRRRTSRKRSRGEELQVDGGQLDIFAEDAAPDLKRTSAAAAIKKSVGSLRGPLGYPFVALFHRTVVEQGLSSAILIICCERVPSYEGSYSRGSSSSRGEDPQQSHLPASSTCRHRSGRKELLRATLSLLPPSVALIESSGGGSSLSLSDCLLSSLIRLIGQHALHIITSHHICHIYHSIDSLAC